MKAAYWTVTVLAAGVSLLAWAAEEKPRRGQPGGPRSEKTPLDDVRFLFKTEVPAHANDVVLGRPTQHSVTASVLAYADAEGVIEVSTKAGGTGKPTSVFSLKAGSPAEIPITDLQPDTEYFYRLKTRVASGPWKAEPEHSFRTQRPPGSAFTFTLQADSHLDYNTDPALYLRCLANALADRPDFHIDLGDTFMTDKHRGRETAAAQYLAQRYYFASLAHSAPLFLVLGNHDGESGRWLDGTTGNLAIWSNAQRKRYFPNPQPDGFYTGNAHRDPQAGLLQDYYAWEWGDALFVVLDPFWYSARQRGGGDNWGSSLGREQYDWLAATLAKSRAKFRFLFLHHLVGGLGKDARGGVEASSLYEWGGHDPTGADLFKEKRPGWLMPIHELLVANHVSIVFHGHDHLFVKQERDGIIYQEVPQPGHPRYDHTRSAEEYGYKSGILLGSSGHLSVRIGPAKATVEYIRAYLPADETNIRQNATVAHTFEVHPR